MPANIPADTYAQLKHLANGGDLRAKAIIGIIQGTFTSAMTTGAGAAPSVTTSGDVAFANLATTTLVLKISSDGGSTFPVTRTHTFGAGPFANIAAVIADIAADAAFMGGATPDLALSNPSGSELKIAYIPTTGATGKVLKVDSSSTGIAGAGLLEFTSNQLSTNSGVNLEFQITDQAGHALAGAKDVIVRALAVAGTAAFAAGTKGTIKKGSGTAEVWCQTDSHGSLELVFTDATSEAVLIKCTTDNGELELNKLTTPLP